MPKILKDALNTQTEKVEKTMKLGPLRKHILSLIHGVILSLQKNNESSTEDKRASQKK